MEELKGLIEELLNHIDEHKEAYNKPEWTNKNIVNAWFRSYDYKFKNLGLFSVSQRSELLLFMEHLSAYYGIDEVIDCTKYQNIIEQYKK